MTQTPKQPIYKYIAIPTDEHFNPDRPSLELACRGNRTMGNILNFLVSRASYIAEKGKLESCKVVSVSIDRDEILKAIRISEKTFTTYLKELNELHYVDSKRYARREYDINFEAINEGIKNPPAQKLRGRPKGSKRQCESGSNKCEENTSTLQENTSTYVLELEKKVEVLSEKLKVLQLKVESITTFEKVLPLLWKVLPLSESDESIPQALREAFSKPLDVLDVNEITKENIYVNADALTRTHSSQETSSENETHYQQSDGSSPQDIHTDQTSTDIPIATPTPQTALIGVATRNTDSLVDVTQVAAPPQKLAKNTSKRGSKRKQDLEAIAPLPPPEKPSIDAPWNVLTCMALADYYRGYTLTNGSYGKALAEATKLIQRGKTYRQVDATYRYMTGTEKKEDGTGLFDEYWHDKTVDIWHVNTHIDAKLKEIREKRNPTPTSTASPSLAQSISATRNLDKEMAEMEARYSRKRAQ